MNLDKMWYLLRDFDAIKWHGSRKKVIEVSNRVCQMWIETGGKLPDDIVDLKTALYMALRNIDMFDKQKNMIYAQDLAEKLMQSLREFGWLKSLVFTTSDACKYWRDKYAVAK